ncbi:MAG: hypothetical protein KatS3mg110_1472 [Pirellulaceae bacterium]|nr:MAG: hypothetical protein KatS3mg110_1472 [Pirellulaceae bacterium]
MAGMPRSTVGCTRRRFLQCAGGGAGWLALLELWARESSMASAARRSTRRVIWIFLHGGPSHVDLFDPKPELERLSGQPLPESFGPVMTRRNVARNPLLGPVARFRRHGQSGLELSDLLPCLARHADDLCLIRGMHGDSVNHPQSVYQMNTGSILMGRPSVGSWIAYGLGSENENLPAFVVLPDPGGGVKGGPPAWGSGFLPGQYQGVAFRAGRHPILNISRPDSYSENQQRAVLELAGELNAEHARQRSDDDRLHARIAAYELAFRMQAAAPELVDLSEETAETLRLYGADQEPTAEFARRCLLARRLVERGVRFVQVYCGDTNGWDAHNDVRKNHGEWCAKSDQPIAALLTDLKRRGLWDDTLVICGGEFGRMPMSEQGKGRDHNPWGYTVWLAGGGVRGGMAYGATDEVGLRAVEKPVAIRDLHATILHLVGLDHEQLTFTRHGLEERLTGPQEARVIHEILA